MSGYSVLGFIFLGGLVASLATWNLAPVILVSVACVGAYKVWKDCGLLDEPKTRG